MKPNRRYQNKPRAFWANVRTISQHVGYTERGTGEIKVPGIKEIHNAFAELSLNADRLAGRNGRVTEFGQTLLDYFRYRAEVLNNFVEPRLMDSKRAERQFQKLAKKTQTEMPSAHEQTEGREKGPSFFDRNREHVDRGQR